MRRYVQFAPGSRGDAGPNDRQGGAYHDRSGTDFLGVDPFLGLQPRQALVAQARTGHRHLLLVPGSTDRARPADRTARARRGRGLQYPRWQWADCVLRKWPRAAVRVAAMAAGAAVSGSVGPDVVLAASPVSWRRFLE